MLYRLQVETEQMPNVVDKTVGEIGILNLLLWCHKIVKFPFVIGLVMVTFLLKDVTPIKGRNKHT